MAEILRFSLRNTSDGFAAVYAPSKPPNGPDKRVPKYEGTVIYGASKDEVWKNMKKDLDATGYQVRRNVWNIKVNDIEAKDNDD